jgi:predicted ATP-grasp superfamily ATP-dependent carboligase
MQVFITDGNQRSALAAVRALGRGGMHVVAGETEVASLAGASRFCSRSMQYPSPLSSPDNFCEFLQKEMRTGKYKLLIPTTDISMQLVASLRNSLPQQLQLALPLPSHVKAIQDKENVMLLAHRFGIPCPTTYMVGRHGTIENVAARVTYPAVIKPRMSRCWENGAWSKGSVEYAYSQEDLVTKYRNANASIARPLVQEMVHGEGRGMFLLVWDGELKAAFSHRRLREKPPSGGVSVLSESLPLDHDLLNKSLALLRELDWQGVAMLEFKQDRDGQLKLMEINGRFWGSLQLAIDAGVNFPVLLYRLACGEHVQPQLKYRIGIKSRWLLGDLDNLIIQLKQKNSSNVYRARALLRFLNFFNKRTKYEVQKVSDFGPGWVECQRYIHSLRPATLHEASTALLNMASIDRS